MREAPGGRGQQAVALLHAGENQLLQLQTQPHSKLRLRRLQSLRLRLLHSMWNRPRLGKRRQPQPAVADAPAQPLALHQLLLLRVLRQKMQVPPLQA